MKIRPIALALVPALVAPAARVAAEDAGRVTFAEHVAPIVFANCTECHRPGEAAPFPLVSFEDVRKRGPTIATVTLDRLMPPWHPDPSYLPLRDARILSDDEIDLIGRWVEQGMPEGDPAATPPVPDFPTGWTLGEPDLVVTMDEAFEVPADGPDVFRCFVLRLDLPEDKWVKAIELRPSAREVVHHALFFTADADAVRRIDGEGGKPGFRRMPFLELRGGLGGWVLGTRPQLLPDDLAMPLPRGTDLVLQTHFHPSGKVEREQATIGLYLADGPPSKRLRGFQVPPSFGRFHLGRIRAGDASHTVRDSRTIDRDVDLIGVGGHAHYRCTSMDAVATLPDGSTRDLFRIGDWDFDWQGRYFFEEPVRLPAGTQVDVTLVYDNSADNPRNPRVPPIDVTFGEQSTDEMGTVSFSYLLADERGPDLRGAGDPLAIGDGDRARLRRLLGGAGAGAPAEAGGASRLREALERLDADGDGRVRRDDVPEAFLPLFDRADLDGDGVLDRAEIDGAVARIRALTGEPDPAPPAGRRRAGRLLDRLGPR